MNKKERIIRNVLQLLMVLMLIALVGYLSSIWFFRLDLTSEKKYTLSNNTKKILEKLPDDIYIRVYLDGDLPVGFRRLQTSTRELLTEFRVYSGRKLKFEFINPSEEEDREIRTMIQEQLLKKGLRPSNAQWRDREGGMSQKIIFPGALINYKGMEMPVNFLRNNPGLSGAENLNRSAEGLEYELINVIRTISSDSIYKIAFLEGQGELFESEVADASRALTQYYTIDRGEIGGNPGILDDYAAVIIAGPTERFKEADKLVLDQYLMKGGRILWLIDPVAVDMDSLIYSSITTAYIRDLNINDMLFKYGVRINANLIQDIQCSYIPVNTALIGNPPQFTPLPWVYFPLLQGEKHPITRNLNLVKSEFISVLDTVKGNGRIKKTFLLKTSPYSRIVGVPNLINLRDASNPLREERFDKQHLPIAVLLEGKFESAFQNRMISEILPAIGNNFQTKSITTKMIVVADADIIRNDVHIQDGQVIPLELGRDRLTQELYGNKDFIVNAINYLIDDSGLMELRTREMRIRLLDRAKIGRSQLFWKLLNTLLPLMIVIFAGILAAFLRKRKYGKRPDKMFDAA